ncbi:peroxiredoxin [Afifella sp. IM 167]|uniref:peroxiredoxin n=1 Tax=Afifella sp. IM 167 TaxID=2033586 RepID=UPI001CCD8ECC|nr:peroxiredoxin [Afifella sp. IM 167]MBZ8133448.1 peroxiredoxin [Afifella sp. IM 167]
MSLSAGDRIPDATFFVSGESGPEKRTAAEIFNGRKVVLFGVPGAYTPTCQNKHLPGFLEHYDAILAKGVDEIVLVAVNDPFVLKAWAESTGAKGKVSFVSDGNAEFAKAAGLDMDGSGVGLGTRIKRFAAVVDDGTVKTILVEDSPGQADKSSAASIMEAL